MKKAILAIIVFVVITTSVFAATTFFSDISTSDWFYSDVMNMAEWDVIQGYPDGTFQPANNVNRAELSAMWNRYDSHVTDKINVALVNLVPTDTSSVQTEVDLSEIENVLGEIYWTFANKQVELSSYDFNMQFNNARFNDLGSSYPINCSSFDLSKNMASAYLDRARDFKDISVTEEYAILNDIDYYKDLCNSL